MRRNIGRHADGNPHRAIQQDIGQARRQQHRLFEGSVEVIDPIHRALTQFAQQGLGIGGQAGFRITHRGERFRVIRRSPVTLAVDQRIAIGKILRHQHHGFIAGGIAMRMVFTQYVTDCSGRFFVFGQRGQTQLRHRIDDASLYRLQAVADMGQSPVQNHVHGIIQIRFLGEIF